MKCTRHPRYKGVRAPTSKELNRHNCSCRQLFTLNHWHKGLDFLLRSLSISEASIRKYGRDMGLGVPPRIVEDVDQAVVDEVEAEVRKEEERFSKRRDRILIRKIADLEAERQAMLCMEEESSDLAVLEVVRSNSRGEGVANALLSDYHLEERVLGSEVEGKNRYNLDISEARLQEFFRAVLRFVEIEQKETDINKLVLWMLGDNITGWLHEENLATCLLEPARALVVARARLKQGIQYLLEQSTLDLVIPCVVGNHGRMTRRPNHATENGNSLEFILYHYLKVDFENEPRVKFIIPESGFAFVDEFGYVIRGSHGHRVRYQGGILGIGVPVAKKLAQWNKIRWADLDVFGHHHVAQDGENFIANGSVLGFNAYAYKEGFSYQVPEQKFFVVHSKWGRRILSRSIFFTR